MRKQTLVARAIHANRRALAALALALAACVVPPPQAAAEAAMPVLSVGDIRCDEGSTASVPITKNAPASSYSKLRVWTPGHGTATIGVDYPAFDVTVIVANSALVVRVPFACKADSLVEGDEVAAVQIASVRNATIGRAIGIVTIADKTAAPPPATQTCPDGSVIPATSICPVPPPPPPAAPPPGKALALSACPALNRPESIVVGRIYDVAGFGGLAEPGGPPPPPGTKDVVFLSDSAHPGDGWYSLYVPGQCVTLG